MGQRPAVMAAWLKTEVYTVQGGPGGPDTKKRVGREQEGGWRPVEGVLEGRGGGGRCLWRPHCRRQGGHLTPRQLDQETVARGGRTGACSK